jgi:hypothetical protein
VCELHLQVLIMRDVNLVNRFIILTYPDCTVLPFTDHVHDALSDTRCPVVMQNTKCLITELRGDKAVYISSYCLPIRSL